jgi:hypothetical protein
LRSFSAPWTFTEISSGIAVPLSAMMEMARLALVAISCSESGLRKLVSDAGDWSMRRRRDWSSALAAWGEGTRGRTSPFAVADA